MIQDRRWLVLVVMCLLFIKCKSKPLESNLGTAPIEIPAIIYSLNTDYVELYNKAWILAKEHVKKKEGLVQTPYIDEAFQDDTIWIWDTAFMLHFFKYAPFSFPSIESLNNFYAPIHDHLENPLKNRDP